VSPLRTTVHLVRHGEVHNPEKILYGRLPGYGLSETGRVQAKRVAEHLGGADVTALLVSPMQRAQETAEPVAAALGLEPVTEDRLIEAGNAFEGLHVGVGDGALRRPEYWPLLRNPFRPSWGEPYLEIAHRMLGAAHRARATRPRASPTSCRSGRCGGTRRASGCGTTRGTGSARSAR
jgi:broad specificity phosphatase PhoE